MSGSLPPSSEHRAPVAEALGDVLADRDAAGEREHVDRRVRGIIAEHRRRIAGDDREAIRRQPSLVQRPASQSAASGVRSDGFSTIGAPAAIAGATL